MTEYFEIAGTRIRFAEIRDFRLVKREYIYRPMYRETDKFSLQNMTGKRYVFAGMQPYAAIYGENGRTSAVSEYHAKDFAESVGKDLFEGVLTTIGDAFNLKAFRAKKYACINQAGRRFTTYLDDIPTVVARRDGKISDVQKNDELYPLLGEPIAPTIQLVEALQIKAKEPFLFFGSGIDVENTGEEFQRLSRELDAYREAEKKTVFPKFLFRLPGQAVQELPGAEKPQIPLIPSIKEIIEERQE